MKFRDESVFQQFPVCAADPLRGVKFLMVRLPFCPALRPPFPSQCSPPPPAPISFTVRDQMLLDSAMRGSVRCGHNRKAKLAMLLGPRGRATPGMWGDGQGVGGQRTGQRED